MSLRAALRCPTCGGSRLCRPISHSSGGFEVVRPGWVCLDHPEVGHLDMQQMAELLAATGKIAYGDAISLLRVEILGVAMKERR